MQATAVIPTGSNIIRGLLSEYAVERSLEKLQEKHAEFGLPPITEIIPVQRDETPGGKHADYIVKMKDGARIVDVPLEVKSSDYCARIFKNKCRRRNWGNIPTVVAHPCERILDYSLTLMWRVAEQLIAGFKVFRRRLCDRTARKRNPELKKRRTRDDSHPQFVRIHPARISNSYSYMC